MVVITKDISNFLSLLKNNGGLPCPKGVALEVINLSKREDISIHYLSKLISSDPALSTCIVKAASVLSFGSIRPVVSIADAITLLGFRALGQLVLGLTLMSDFRNGGCKQFDYSYYWTHSLITAVAVRQLAEQSRLAAAADELFTLGLLGGVGKLVMATAFPKEYGTIIEVAKGVSLDQFYKLEREQFGFDHAQLTVAVLDDMKFPSVFLQSIHDFPQPECSRIIQGSREWRIMNLLHMAFLLANALLAAQAEQNHFARKFWIFAKSMDLNDSEIIHTINSFSRVWPEWANLLKINFRSILFFEEAFENLSNAVVD